MVTAMSRACARFIQLRGTADQRTEGDEDPLQVRLGQDDTFVRQPIQAVCHRVPT